MTRRRQRGVRRRRGPPARTTCDPERAATACRAISGRGPGPTPRAHHLQAFFAEHLLAHKRASPQTIASYRDTFRLLLRFMQEKTGTEPSALPLAALDADAVLAFLDHLKRDRGCSVRSRNNRLAAIRSFFRVVSAACPGPSGAGDAGHGDPDQARRQAAGALSEPRRVKALLAAPTGRSGPAGATTPLLLTPVQHRRARLGDHRSAA